MEIYSNLLYKYLKKFDVKIIAYCIMNNHAHLLIYVEQVNALSEFMRAVNTTYALYYNKKYKKVGYVFRNRYKTEPIYNEKYLINCIHYIHDNPIKANICKVRQQYKYSSYYEYKLNKGKIIPISKRKFSEINMLFIDHIYEQTEIDCNFMDYIEEKDFIDKKTVIEEYINNNRIKREDIIFDKEIFRKLSIDLNKKCGLTHQEIANEFSVNRLKVTRMINSK